MTRSPRDRPSAAEKKERQVRTGQVDRGMAVPATSADLVNLPQDFSLNSSWQRPARQCTNGFNVRASLFVGPRLSVVFPEGVQGVPWRRRARLPASDPRGKDMQELKVLTSGPLSSSAPDCLSSSLKEYRASLGAVVLGSQSAIPVEGHVGASLPVGQPPRAFLLDRMLDQCLHGRKSRECFLRPFHSAFKAASHLQDDASVSLLGVSTLVLNGTF